MNDRSKGWISQEVTDTVIEFMFQLEINIFSNPYVLTRTSPRAELDLLHYKITTIC